jgi:60 kDa SS-A/Ro ribonucleoprotein
MSDYLKVHGTRAPSPTHQSKPMRDDQVKNSAGGFVWAVDDWTRLQRFLILGSEGGSYYASEHKLTFENVQCIRSCVAEDGLRTVQAIVDVSEGGRAPKNDPALYALAVAFSLGDKETKLAAGKALPRVARIATHLYHFVAYMETMRGWGRMARKAVSEWYAQNPDQLAYQAVKYRQRDGWSHRDLLRLAHPSNDANAAVFDWICHGASSTQEKRGAETGWVVQSQEIINGFEAAQRSKTAKETADLVRQYNLPREALLSEHLNSIEVWNALLEQKMPMHAMVRNLATMTRIGVLQSRDHLRLVTDALASQDAIRKSRLHPMALLIALRTYAEGQGFRGSNTWNPIPDVTDALDGAFYLAFDNVEPTGKRHLLALDVSGSMGSVGYGEVPIAGSSLTPREASVAMALITLHAEKDVAVMGFTHGFVPIPISRRQRLDDAVRAVSHLPFDRTDCAQPMLHALKEKWAIDAFFVYTDSETWAGNIHPKQALDQYRQASGIQAKSVVVGMVSNGFSIADPNDPGQLDVVGFDTAAPAVMADFVR